MLEVVLTASIPAASLLTFLKLPQVQKFLSYYQLNLLPLLPSSCERNPPGALPRYHSRCVPEAAPAVFGAKQDPALGTWVIQVKRGMVWPWQHPSPASNPLWGPDSVGLAALQLNSLRLNSSWSFEGFHIKETKFLCSKLTRIFS